MTMTTIYIDMSEQFTDEELIIEIQKRGYVVRDKDEPAPIQGNDLLRIYEALYLGKQEEALQRTREYVCNVLGRTL